MQRLELAGVRRSVLLALLIAFLIPVAVAVWALTQVGGSSSNPSASASVGGTTGHAAVKHPAMPMATNYRQSTLFKALAGVNLSQFAKGLLPPSSCKAMSATEVMCKQPHYAVDEVIFRSFSSDKALYAAYQSRVEAIGQAPFRANYGNCTETMTSGEVGWNHDFKHPSMYPMGDFTSGRITDDQAAGRVYCTFENSDLYLVWTQDDGRVLGELSGAPHVDAYVWWRQVHHSLVMPGSPNMMMAMEGPMSGSSTTSTTTTLGSKGAKSMPGAKSAKSMPSMK